MYGGIFFSALSLMYKRYYMFLLKLKCRFYYWITGNIFGASIRAHFAYSIPEG
jgi:hypothetical protein